MKFDVQYKGRAIRLDITSEDSLYRLEYEGKKIGFRCERIDESCLSIMIGEKSYEAHVHAAPPAYGVQLQDLSYDFEVMEGGTGAAGVRRGGVGPHRITAPMPGKVVSVLRAPGDALKEGDGVVVIEAMKMQNELRTPRAGTLKEIRVAAGETVESGAVVAIIVPAAQAKTDAV
ncbi:MAG: acetyl-CoA carboxylase biotin carboxyl carrier protein subunit [Acidobacteria bacterium]|nr:acetyl-CoA carboxylase biotin carboxyl carrier protein subunit [Acidobacteriota bacterium]